MSSQASWQTHIPNGASCFDFPFQGEGNGVCPLDITSSTHLGHHCHPPPQNRHKLSNPEPPYPLQQWFRKEGCLIKTYFCVFSSQEAAGSSPNTHERSGLEKTGQSSPGACWHRALQPEVGRELELLNAPLLLESHG